MFVAFKLLKIKLTMIIYFNDTDNNTVEQKSII